MQKNSAFLLIAICFWSAGACADASHDAKYCNENQMQMNECAKERADVADAELNKLYKILMSRQADEEIKSFQDAERAWVTFKNKECSWEADQYKGGSLAPMMFSACVERLTKERSHYFQSLIEQ